MPKTLKLRCDMVKIDTIVFGIVPLPRIVSCLKHPGSDRVKGLWGICYQRKYGAV